MKGFSSPAYGVSQELQAILERNRQRERQALLDQLQSRQVEAGIENQKASTESQRAYRDAQIENMKNLQQNRMLSTLTPHQELDTDTAGMVPDTLKTPAWNTVLGGPGATSTVDGEEVPGDPTMTVQQVTPETFKGLPESQENERIGDESSDYMSSPSYKTDDPLTKVMKLRGISRDFSGGIPAGAFPDPVKDPHSPAYIEYQDYVKSLPAGTQPLTFDKYMEEDANRRRPVTNNGTDSFQFMPETDPKTYQPTGRIFAGNRRTGGIIPASLPAPPKPGEVPVQTVPNENAPASIINRPPPTEQQKTFPLNKITALSKSRIAAKPRPGIPFLKDPSFAYGAGEAYVGDIIAVIDDPAWTQSAQQILVEIVMNEKLGQTPLDAIFANIHPPPTDETKTDVQRALTIIKGEFR